MQCVSLCAVVPKEIALAGVSGRFVELLLNWLFATKSGAANGEEYVKGARRFHGVVYVSESCKPHKGEAPNDPKLSDRGARRVGCTAGGKAVVARRWRKQPP